MVVDRDFDRRIGVSSVAVPGELIFVEASLLLPWVCI